MKKWTILWGLCLIGSVEVFASAGESDKDWMLHPDGFKARVYQENNQLILSNGLVERVFQEGTTVRLNNLMTGEGLLRSVRPEVELCMDSLPVRVGGLSGQPVHNYLLPEWLADMQRDSMALQYAGYEVRPIVARFPWKPRKGWISGNAVWPPKGKELILKYRADEALVGRWERFLISDQNRQKVVEADFTKTLPEGWKVVTSATNKANAFENEGKVGEILVPSNTCAYAERDLPANAEVLIARINPGTDKSSHWGPGLAWVFDKGYIKCYLRTSDGKFGMTGTGLEHGTDFSGYRPGVPVYIRMQRMGNTLTSSFSYDGAKWTELQQVSLPQGAVSRCVRIGKMDAGGGNTEADEKGKPGRCRMDVLTVLGGLQQGNGTVGLDYWRSLEVDVHYEIYDGIPLISKWFTLANHSSDTLCLDSYKSEILAVMEPENTAVFDKSFMTPNITVESDFAHANQQDLMDARDNQMYQRHVHWNKDPLYNTQVDWLMKTPCLLESYPEYGPAESVGKGEVFSSHRIWELFHDTWDRERKTMQIRKMYRVAAPWTAENPIFMHVRNADDASVRKAIDQCAEVGFEMVIMTFWSGVNLEDDSAENLERMSKLADYAHSKGIALGGYSLLASRSIDPENDVVMPEGHTPQFGASPCVESRWGQEYLHKLRNYFKVTGQDILEHDGSYPGDECAATTHPGHKGLADSQWKQYQEIKKFYQDCKAEGIFLNIPDWYFMNGQNKTAMGYREANWSLPRKQQEIIERQNIYDGTWLKTPSMGWMMVPLVEYHGGGEAATIEPLKEHLPHYEMRLANNFGAGVIACYRGPQLFDAPETKAVVKKWVDFYKAHRQILDSDLVHLRRPDGTDWDGFVHVNPSIDEKGLLMVYNPLPEVVRRVISVPLYYTGLTDQVWVHDSKGNKVKRSLNRDYSLTMEIEIPPYGCNWYVFK